MEDKVEKNLKNKLSSSPVLTSCIKSINLVCQLSWLLTLPHIVFNLVYQVLLENSHTHWGDSMSNNNLPVLLMAAHPPPAYLFCCCYQK